MLLNLGLELLSTVGVWRIVVRFLPGLLSNVAVILFVLDGGVSPVVVSSMAVTVLVNRSRGNDWVGVDIDSENATSQRYSRRLFSCVGKIRFQVQR